MPGATGNPKRFRSTKPSTTPVKFGGAGKSVRVPTRTVDKARREGRRLYEDGSMGPKRARRGGV